MKSPIKYTPQDIELQSERFKLCGEIDIIFNGETVYANCFYLGFWNNKHRFTQSRTVGKKYYISPGEISDYQFVRVITEETFPQDSQH